MEEEEKEKENKNKRIKREIETDRVRDIYRYI